MTVRRGRNGSSTTRWWASALAASALALGGAVVVAPSPAAAAPTVAPAPSELLPDGGFEAGNGGWVPFNDTPVMTRVTSPVRSGSYAMKVTATQPLYTLVGMTQNTVVTSSSEGAAYTASCYVRPSTPNLEVRIRLLQYTQNFATNQKLGTNIVSTLPANTWTKVTVTGTATAAGQRIIPQIYASFQTTSTGYLVYDDCSLTMAPKPGPSNTGVPAGTRLTVLEPGSTPPAGTSWYGDVLKVTKDGTVLDSLEIRGEVRVEAANVVIKNCLITGQYLDSSFSLIYISGPSYSVTVQDSELYAKYPSAWVRGVIGYNFTLVRVNIHDVIDQMAITGNNVVVKDSWLHNNLYYLQDPAYNNTPSHDDNAQVQQGMNITFTHNTMEGTHNSAMQITQDAGVVGNVRLENNLIGYGGCSLNFAQKQNGPIQGITLQSNRFTHTSGYNCPVIISAGSRGNLKMDDNRWVTWNGSSWVADMSGTIPVQTN